MNGRLSIVRVEKTSEKREQVRPIVETASLTLCISDRVGKIDVGVGTTKLSLTCKRARKVRNSHADVRMATSSRQTCRCWNIVEAKPQEAVKTSAPPPTSSYTSENAPITDDS